MELEVPGGWRVSMKARTDAMGKQCTADGWRCRKDVGDGPVRSLGGLLLTIKREQR